MKLAPAAPLLDRYGLHAESCECARCVLGYRPTPRERDVYRRIYEATERRRAEEAKRAADGLPPHKTKTDRAIARRAALDAAEREGSALVREIEQAAAAPVPPADEMDELRAAAGLPPRRKGT